MEFCTYLSGNPLSPQREHSDISINYTDKVRNEGASPEAAKESFQEVAEHTSVKSTVDCGNKSDCVFKSELMCCF